MLDPASIIKDIDNFCEEVGMSPSALGEEAVRDRNLIGDMKRKENPRSPSVRTLNKLYAYMEKRRAERSKSGADAA